MRVENLYPHPSVMNFFLYLDCTNKVGFLFFFFFLDFFFLFLRTLFSESFSKGRKKPTQHLEEQLKGFKSL